MEFKSPDCIPHFRECSAVADSLGCSLVELQVVPQKGNVHITAVIASKDAAKDIGVSDCSKVHRALEAKLMALLEKDEDHIYMEVCSPGLDRNIKNAWEFSVFCGKNVRVWDREAADWISGRILSSDETSVQLELQDGAVRHFSYENIAKAKFINL